MKIVGIFLDRRARFVIIVYNKDDDISSRSARGRLDGRQPVHQGLTARKWPARSTRSIMWVAAWIVRG